MSALPITPDTVDSIFGASFYNEGSDNSEDPSSDYEVVVDWFVEQIDPQRTQIDLLPLRVSNVLNRMGRCNNMLFQKFRGMVRFKLNAIAMKSDTAVGSTFSRDDSGAIFHSLLDQILNLIGILRQTYDAMNLSKPQIQLMRRLGNSVYQSWVEDSLIWSNIRQYYEHNIFSEGEIQRLEKVYFTT